MRMETVKRRLFPEEKPKESAILLSESKLARFGLIFSLIVIVSKAYSNNRDYLASLLLDQKIVQYETFTEEGQQMFIYSWNTFIKYSRFWFPIVCGAATTYFTWLMVYLDSEVPGVYPPSPLSPTKYKVKSGHVFHLNYMFAIIIGFLVTAYLYWQGAEI